MPKGKDKNLQFSERRRCKCHSELVSAVRSDVVKIELDLPRGWFVSVLTSSSVDGETAGTDVSTTVVHVSLHKYFL
jgi:hypothetical protein